MTLYRQDGRLNTGVAVVLGMFALALLLMSSRGCSTPWSGGFDHGWLGLRPFGPFYSLLSIWGLIQLGLAVWVGVDANRRGSHGILWGLLVFVTGIVGLLVYLLVAPTLAQRNSGGASPGGGAPFPFRAAARRCPGCGTQVQPDFKACPHCGAGLSCGQCGKPIEAGWRVCPYCEHTLSSSAGSPPAG